MDVLILAGGKCDSEFRAKTGCEFRGEVPFQGRTLVQIALDATRGTGRQVVVGSCPDSSVEQIPAGEGFLESLEAGMNRVGEEFLMVTADLPLVRPEHIRAFLESKSTEADMVVPVMTSADCEAVAPGVARTTLQLKEGQLTAGNVLWARTKAMRSLLPRVREGYANRKSVSRLARLVGPRVLAKIIQARLLPGSVSAESLATAVGRQLGLRVQALLTHDAELGTDVDRYSQYEALLALQKSGQTADI